MKPRTLLRAGLLIALMLLSVTPALAGGWAVITLDELPGQVVAGEPLEVGFTVRQHGVTPMDGLTPIVSARYAGLTVNEQARPQGETGHYVAVLNFPQPGAWEWSIQAFGEPQPMPALVVAAPSVANQPAKQGEVRSNVPLLVGSLGLAGLAAGLFVAFRRKARWAIALALAGLILGAGSIVYAAQQLPAGQEAVERLAASPASQVDTGRRLFIAKGCMLCHSHNETNQERRLFTDTGPDLTNLTASPDYLRVWLKDPQAAKSSAKMPNLGLKETEIEALIAFLNAD